MTSFTSQRHGAGGGRAPVQYRHILQDRRRPHGLKISIWGFVTRRNPADQFVSECRQFDGVAVSLGFRSQTCGLSLASRLVIVGSWFGFFLAIARSDGKNLPL